MADSLCLEEDGLVQLAMANNYVKSDIEKPVGAKTIILSSDGFSVTRRSGNQISVDKTECNDRYANEPRPKTQQNENSMCDSIPSIFIVPPLTSTSQTTQRESVVSISNTINEINNSVATKAKNCTMLANPNFDGSRRINQKFSYDVDNGKCIAIGNYENDNTCNNNNNRNKIELIGSHTVALGSFPTICQTELNAVDKCSNGEGDLKPPLSNTKYEDDLRKKRRCADRYDSSESSDSGVATLSCADSSTTSSDTSDPGSPYSLSSCEETSQANASQLQQVIPHQWPWNTTITIGSTNANTIHNSSINKRSLALDNAVTIKKNRSNSDMPSQVIAVKKPQINYKQKNAEDNALPDYQTKITGFFKSQIKPANGLKRDLTNMVVRSKEFPKIDNVRRSCDFERSSPSGLLQPQKRMEKKTTTRIATLVPISRKTSNAPVKKVALASKKPVNIAPRTIEPKQMPMPPRLVSKLQEIRQKPIEQSNLLTTIRLPQHKHVATQSQAQQPNILPQKQPYPTSQSQQQHHHHQQQQQQHVNIQATQLLQHTQNIIETQASTKVGHMFQLHSPVMPKLVQIPNILTKGTNNLLLNNGHIARINPGPHYFLNGAVIKLQSVATDTTTLNETQNGISIMDSNMLRKSPNIETKAVPFQTKHVSTLQQATTAQIQNYNGQQVATYSQPIFMATSSGLLLSTAIPTVITSQISGLQAIGSPTAISTLHQYTQQTSSSVLSNIGTVLPHNQSHLHTGASSSSSSSTTSFVSPQCNFHLNATEKSANNLNQIGTNDHLLQLSSVPVQSSTFSSPPVTITLCSSPRQFSTNFLPPLITSTTMVSTEKSCVSAMESSPILILPDTKTNAMPNLAQISINVENSNILPKVASCPQHAKDKHDGDMTYFYSPTVPLMSPKSHSSDSLPSPKSLILERIQQKKLDGTDDENVLKKNLIDLLEIPTIETAFQAACLPECAKSPILSQPKTIRFPPLNSNITRNGNRRSDGRIIGVCYWDNCNIKYDTSSKLLDHLQTQHVNTQLGPFMCQWSGCKVHGRESCSRRWLERHVLSHGGTKPFKCIVDGCGLRFGSQLALQKHVNGHFNTTDSKEQSTKRSSDPPVPKKLKLTGKKLRYRRQPFSARMFDYFDGGAMEILQHRLAHTATAANGPGGSIHFHGKQIAKRVTATGIVELLIKWHPCNIISDEWIANANPALTKTIKVQSMTPIERISLQKFLRHLYKCQNLKKTTDELAIVSAAVNKNKSVKHKRKPSKIHSS